MARAFSEQSLREQEEIIDGVIQRWVDRVGEVSKAEGAVDLTRWFNLMTFGRVAIYLVPVQNAKGLADRGVGRCYWIIGVWEGFWGRGKWCV